MGKEKQSKRRFLRPGFKPGHTDLKSELLTAWLLRRRLKTKKYFLKVKEFFRSNELQLFEKLHQAIKLSYQLQ